MSSFFETITNFFRRPRNKDRGRDHNGLGGGFVYPLNSDIAPGYTSDQSDKNEQSGSGWESTMDPNDIGGGFDSSDSGGDSGGDGGGD